MGVPNRGEEDRTGQTGGGDPEGGCAMARADFRGVKLGLCTWWFWNDAGQLWPCFTFQQFFRSGKRCFKETVVGNGQCTFSWTMFEVVSLKFYELHTNLWGWVGTGGDGGVSTKTSAKNCFLLMALCHFLSPFLGRGISKNKAFFRKFSIKKKKHNHS